MHKPDANKHNPDPANVRKLVHKAIKHTERPLAEIATLYLGVDQRTIRHWLNGTRTMPYTSQYTLEALCTL